MISLTEARLRELESEADANFAHRVRVDDPPPAVTVMPTAFVPITLPWSGRCGPWAERMIAEDLGKGD